MTSGKTHCCRTSWAFRYQNIYCCTTIKSNWVYHASNKCVSEWVSRRDLAAIGRLSVRSALVNQIDGCAVHFLNEWRTSKGQHRMGSSILTATWSCQWCPPSSGHATTAVDSAQSLLRSAAIVNACPRKDDWAKMLQSSRHCCCTHPRAPFVLGMVYWPPYESDFRSTRHWTVGLPWLLFLSGSRKPIDQVVAIKCIKYG